MQARLDIRTLDGLKPPSRGQMDIWDSSLPGFGIRLSQGGSKSWVVMVRRGNRRARLTLGPYPDLSPDAARAQALHYLSQRDGRANGRRGPSSGEQREHRAPGLTPDLLATARRALVLLQAVLESDTPQSPSPAEAPRPTAIRHHGRRRRILLVEDTDTNRMVVLAMLALEPYDIDTATNGWEAVEAVKATPYDLVIMDVSMPVMDGLSAAAAIRALPGPESRVPIIAMTAHAMASDRERCLAAGMDDYLSKPVLRDELIDKIEARLGMPPESRDTPAPLPAALDASVLTQLSHDLRADGIGGFIDTLLPDIESRVHGIYAAQASGNLAALSAHAHGLVGLAATFGAHALESLARTIDTRARSGATESLPALLDALKPVVEETVTALRELRRRPS
jgi:CheY-like chemotaxis protein/HPt (histidine-containing phosphotransfer) domain-containing protein